MRSKRFFDVPHAEGGRLLINTNIALGIYTNPKIDYSIELRSIGDLLAMQIKKGGKPVISSISAPTSPFYFMTGAKCPGIRISNKLGREPSKTFYVSIMSSQDFGSPECKIELMKDFREFMKKTNSDSIEDQFSIVSSDNSKEYFNLEKRRKVKLVAPKLASFGATFDSIKLDSRSKGSETASEFESTLKAMPNSGDLSISIANSKVQTTLNWAAIPSDELHFIHTDNPVRTSECRAAYLEAISDDYSKAQRNDEDPEIIRAYVYDFCDERLSRFLSEPIRFKLRK